jgi:hypothetical protein
MSSPTASTNFSDGQLTPPPNPHDRPELYSSPDHSLKQRPRYTVSAHFRQPSPTRAPRPLPSPTALLPPPADAPAFTAAAFDRESATRYAAALLSAAVTARAAGCDARRARLLRRHRRGSRGSSSGSSSS